MFRQFLVLSAMTLCLTHCVSGGQIAELDLDGEIGNGPDQVVVAVGTIVEVEVWLIGGEPLFAFDLRICNFDESLAYEGTEYHVPSTWSESQPQFPAPGCVRIVAADFAYMPFPQPAHTATMRYVAGVDHSVAYVDVDRIESEVWYADDISNPVVVDSTVGVFVRIGSTGTEESSWGSVKRLFR